MTHRAEIIKLLADDSDVLAGISAEEIMKRTGCSRPTFYRVLKNTPAIKHALRPKSPATYYLDVTDESLMSELSTMAAKRVLENKLSELAKLKPEDRVRMIAPIVKALYVKLDKVVNWAEIPEPGTAELDEHFQSLITYCEYQLALREKRGK